MRSNLPVTQREYVLKDDETIVSKTDLKGKITYVNQDFVRISGFTEEELLRAPHNIVRHPDMPEEAFEDMWRTLKSGKAWTGLVKNRCKNGDHYWVEANAAPLIENHQVTGYTSIRGKPSRQQVHEAEAAYRLIKSGQSRLRIHEGHAIARSAFSWHGQMEELTLSAKMLMVFGVLLLLSCANALLAYLMQGNSSTALGTSAIAVAGVGVLATILSGMLLYKAIVGPLRYALDEIETMSSGDLTSKIQASGSDEVAKLLQALRVLQINTKFLVGQIRQSTDIVNDEASEIADGVMDLSHRTESQANSLEQTASSMTQFTTIVKRNAGQALEASNLIRSTAEIASKGGDAVNHVVDTMSSIKASSSKMADIISVIDGIAFQTNILALNAAVEAARAGEQGRGFAVVASEVRNLAQRSAGAAKEIKVLIHNSIETVEEGSHLVDIAGHTMSDIVEAVQHASEIMMAISASGQEQTEGIDQVNRAMMHMDEITQQNAALGEQAAAASSTMKEQAHHLSELVGAFRLMSGNARSAALPEIRRAAVASPSRQVAPQNRMLK